MVPGSDSAEGCGEAIMRMEKPKTSLSENGI